MRSFTVRGVLEIRFELNVLAESEQEAEDVALTLDDADFIESATETSMFLTGVALP